ncbi:autotransporter-associated beta strand repeat-containing protein [Akkermansia glycaniphila]|uniref:autotransporter-associated beta strand repeat-containing protein n=1 Tax=Akkermansia glycaniphila TaxID=1679444 RepID=UPI001C01CF69|nr:autotransporter-associated beta strand repeat-containing protein [Akkermansia glycaniphila]MBT9448862.1 autotransporter-associated beta strand repeat-containing protein [Akkermansia glycaniphila]
MKLHLPLSLRSALLACFASVSSVFAAVPAVTSGSIAFCGDSITQAAGGGIGNGYRFQVFKNFVDNGVAYNPVGSHQTNGAEGSAALSYAGMTFNKTNEGHSGWWASDLTGDSGAGTHGGASHSSIANWTGQSTTQFGTPTPYTGTTYNPEKVFILAGTNDILHMNNTTAPDTATMVARILKCAEQYRAANPNVEVYVGALLPQEGVGYNSWNPSVYNMRVREVNEELKRKAAELGYVFVQTDLGLRGAGDAPLAAASFTGDNLHPNRQGELIMAGNIARALGVGQRSAGLARVAVSDSRFTSMGHATPLSVQGAAWSAMEGQNAFLVRSTGRSFFQQSWSDAGFDMAKGFTCELSLQMFSNASANNLFSLQVGNGTANGLLNITEDRISWGATILYVGSNTDEVVDFRVVYHTGAAADGSSVSSGYYVWRNGVLIGEALSSTGAGYAGLQAGALQGGGVLAGVTDLSWSNSGAFAADYTGLAAADKDAKGTERLSNSSLDSSTVPSTSWVVDWPTGATVIAKSSLADVRTDINNLGTTVNARVTGEVLNGASSATASFITSTTASSAYIELAGTWKAAANSNNFFNVACSSHGTGNVYFKVGEGGRIVNNNDSAYSGTVFGMNAISTFNGNMYLEFSSSALSMAGGQVAALGYYGCIVGTWNSNINGSSTMVFSNGSFGTAGSTGTSGFIIAGGMNNGTSNRNVTGSTFIEISGGTFHNGIAAGGYNGDVATNANTGTHVLISGGTLNGNVYGGSAGNGTGLHAGGNVGTASNASSTHLTIDGSNAASSALAVNGSLFGGSRGAGVVFGDTNITVRNFTESTLSSFGAGAVLNGGSEGGGEVRGSRNLTFSNVKGTFANKLSNFDALTLNGGADVRLGNVASSSVGRVSVATGARLAAGANVLNGAVFSGGGTLELSGAGTYALRLMQADGKGSLIASGTGVKADLGLGAAESSGGHVRMGSLALGSDSSLMFDLGKNVATSAFSSLTVDEMSSDAAVRLLFNLYELRVGAGEYTLIAGDLSRVASFDVSSLVLPEWQHASWNTDTYKTDGKLVLTVTGDVQDLNWNGRPDGIWKENDEANKVWKDGSGAAAAFRQSDSVFFADVSGTVTIEGLVRPGEISVSGNSGALVLAGSGSIGGTAALVKTGSGSLTIETANTYSGGTTIDGGTVILKSNEALGTGAVEMKSGRLELAAAGGGSYANDWVFNGTSAGNTVVATTDSILSGGVSGTGGFTLGGGRLVLAGTASQAGAIVVNGGATLSLDSISLTGAGGITLNNNSSLELQGQSASTGAVGIAAGVSSTLKGAGSLNATVALGGTMLVGEGKDGGSPGINRVTTGANGTIMADSAETRTLRVTGELTVSGVTLNLGSANAANSGKIVIDGKMFMGAANNALRVFSDAVVKDLTAGGYASTIEVADGKTLTAIDRSSQSNNAATITKTGTGRFVMQNWSAATKSNVTINAGTFEFAPSGDLTYGSVIGGTGKFAKSGVGRLILTGNNTFTGGTELKEGVLRAGNANALAGRALAVTGNSTLELGMNNAALALSLNSLSVAAGSNLNVLMDIGATQDSINMGGGSITGSGTVLVKFANVTGFAAAGSYTLVTNANATAASHTATLDFDGAVLGRGQTGVLAWDGGSLKLTVAGTAQTDAASLTWAGPDDAGIWRAGMGDAVWNTATATDRFYTGDHVVFGAAGAHDLALVGKVSPGSIRVEGDRDYAFGGTGEIGGSGNLTKTGNSTLTLGTNNSGWSGAIALQQGKIAFAAGGLGTGAITATGGTTLQWLNGASDNIWGRLSIVQDALNGKVVTLDTGVNNVSVAEGQAIAGSGNGIVKLGSGTLSFAGRNHLAGSLTIGSDDADGGTAVFGVTSAVGTVQGIVNGDLIVKNGKAVVTSDAKSVVGWTAGTLLSRIVMEEKGVFELNSEQSARSLALVFHGGTLATTNNGAFLFMRDGSAPFASIESQASAQTATMEANLVLNQTGTTMTVAKGTTVSGVDFVMSGNLSAGTATNTVTKEGAGTLQFTAGYGESGVLTVNGGTVIVSGQSFGASKFVVGAQGTFVFDMAGNEGGYTYSRALEGSGVVGVGAGKTLVLGADNSAFGGSFAVGAGATLTANAAAGTHAFSTRTADDAIVLSGVSSRLLWSAASSADVLGQVSGTGTVEVSNGTLKLLHASNAYGDTLVKGGTLATYAEDGGNTVSGSLGSGRVSLEGGTLDLGSTAALAGKAVDLSSGTVISHAGQGLASTTVKGDGSVTLQLNLPATGSDVWNLGVLGREARSTTRVLVESAADVPSLGATVAGDYGWVCEVFSSAGKAGWYDAAAGRIVWKDGEALTSRTTGTPADLVRQGGASLGSAVSGGSLLLGRVEADAANNTLVLASPQQGDGLTLSSVLTYEGSTATGKEFTVSGGSLSAASLDVTGRLTLASASTLTGGQSMIRDASVLSLSGSSSFSGMGGLGELSILGSSVLTGADAGGLTILHEVKTTIGNHGVLTLANGAASAGYQAETHVSDGGTLQIGSAGAGRSAAVSGNLGSAGVDVANGGLLKVNAGSSLGSADVSVANGGRVEMLGGALFGGSSLSLANGATLALQGNVSLDGNTIFSDRGANPVATGVISVSGGTASLMSSDVLRNFAGTLQAATGGTFDLNGHALASGTRVSLDGGTVQDLHLTDGVTLSNARGTAGRLGGNTELAGGTIGFSINPLDNAPYGYVADGVLSFTGGPVTFDFTTSGQVWNSYKGSNERTYVLVSAQGISIPAGADVNDLVSIRGIALENTRFQTNLAWDDAAGAFVLGFDGEAGNLRWAQAAGGSWGIGAGMSQWDMNGSQTDFMNHDNVLFGQLDGTAGPVAVDVSTADMFVGNMTFEGGTDYTFTGAGSLQAGAEQSSLSKTGSGTLTMGIVNTNYHGSVQLDGGTVNAVSQDALGTGNRIVVNGSVLNASVANALGTGAGGVLVLQSGSVHAGADGAFGDRTISMTGGLLDMGGHAVSNGVTMSGGALANAWRYDGALRADASASGLSLGGVDAARVSDLIVGNGHSVSDLAAGSRLVLAENHYQLTLNAGNLDSRGGSNLIEFRNGQGTVAVANGAPLVLLADDGVYAALQNLYQGDIGGKAGQIADMLHVTNGTLDTGSLLLADRNGVALDLDSLEMYVKEIRNGAVVLSWFDVYKSSNGAINSYDALQRFAGVDLGGGSLSVNLGAPNAGETLEIKRLSGSNARAVLSLNGTSNTAAASVTLVNSASRLWGNGNPDSRFAGSILAANTDIVKKGTGTLTVEGRIDLDRYSSLSIEEGGISGNNRGTVYLSGNLKVAQGGRFEAMALNMESRDAMLTIGNGAVTLTGLSGSGKVSGNGTLAISGSGQSSSTADMGAFNGEIVGLGGSQTLTGTGGSQVGIRAMNGGEMILKSVSAGTTYASLNVAQGGRIGIGLDGSLNSNNRVTLLSGGTVAAGGTLALTLNTMAGLPNPFLHVADGATLAMQNGAKVVLSAAAGQEYIRDGAVPTTMVLVDRASLEGGLQLEYGNLFRKYYSAEKSVVFTRGNELVLTTYASEEGFYGNEKYYGGIGSSTSRAGGALLDAALASLNPQANDADSTLGRVMNYMDMMLDNTSSSYNPQEAARLAAAVAGSTVTSLAMSQHMAMRDQLLWVRNRVTQMGVDPGVQHEDMPYLHMWMQMNGANQRLDQSGDESGYKLSSWGGTVGMHLDLTPAWSAGMAFTAGYGDLTAQGADSLTGDVTMYYLNLFARTQQRDWGHAFIVTGGRSDFSTTRNVRFGQDGYEGKGDTNGTSLGAMYELTYDIFLDEERTSLLQPLFNASFVHTKIDGFEESGAGNAGLNVGSQDMTTATLALGARWMGHIGQNVFGRNAIAEFRLNLAQDMGDRRSSADVAFLGNRGAVQAVRGASIGSTAIQVGGGINVPVSLQSNIYLDVNADLRSGASSVSANVGYRYDF